MARDVLDIAWKEMKRRHFSQAIKLLEARAEFYEENSEYYIMLGTACLYVGDTGSASSYFQKARYITLSDTNLLLGQAAVFLRRGNTERALHYYLEVLENEPANKIAKNALEFIRIHGDYETICRWADSGRLSQFYPPLGVNPDKILFSSAGVIAFALGCVLTVNVMTARQRTYNGPRKDLTSIVLTTEEKAGAQETNLSGQAYHYILSNREITSSYESALSYFQKGDDNHAQIEINRILNSNASVPVKQKANVLMGYLAVPTFDTLGYYPAYKDVEEDPPLYLDCYVIWSGRVSDVEVNGSSYKARFLIGYDSMKNLDGIVNLEFDSVPEIEADKPLKVLAKITSRDGRMLLEGKAVYQSINF